MANGRISRVPLSNTVWREFAGNADWILRSVSDGNLGGRHRNLGHCISVECACEALGVKSEARIETEG